ncbi:DUF6048 family protein [Ichthyenterobacterium magnum]|uniref:Outer membrane protein with beta-barrel domain n=1 Tax=Ichthyenterobacterium magnum TaxID=1230530 RepID=A0A420DKJ4_9FLAO|nr:DUF6048 family protein [Ichthyenterobacterium magnum]RKE94752.1 hypothetical protein BXY80_1764 [Ichthyenterobacterium magnum]
MKHTLISFISIMSLMLVSLTSFSQEEETKTDSLVVKQKYGLRLGADVGKLVKSFLDDDYTGFEINGDYRLTKKIFLAGELGNEKKTTSNDYLTITAKGSYFKAGIDYNMYKNWLDMENMIYAGFRLGVSSFSQTLDNFTVYNTDQYWQDQFSSSPNLETKGLTAIWAEIMIGIKAEVINNLFVGLNVQLKGMVSEDQPSNYENLYVPGFNKTFDSGRFGIGFGYNVSYLIPIFKKDKVIVTEE